MRLPLILLAFLSLSTQAAIDFFSAANPICSATYQVAAEKNAKLRNYTIVMETPRLYLAYVTEHGPTAHRLEAFDKETGENVGWIGMGRGETQHPFFEGRKYAHLPVYFDSAQGKGLGTEGKYAALRYAFEVRGYDAAYASVAQENVSSHGLHEKLGFTALSDRGKSVLYGLTKEKFEEVKKAFDPEATHNFLPRGDFKARVITKTKYVPNGRKVAEVYASYVRELETRLQKHPSLQHILGLTNPSLRTKVILSFSENLAPERQALRKKYADDGEYRAALALLEQPLADAVVWSRLEMQFMRARARAEGEVTDFVMDLEDFAVKGYGAVAREGTRELGKQLLARLRAEGSFTEKQEMRVLSAQPSQ